MGLLVLALGLGSVAAILRGDDDRRDRREAQDVKVKGEKTGRPSEASTGVREGTRLRPSGSILVRKDGAVIQNLDVDGSITVRADDVTIRNVRVRSSSPSYGINITQGSAGTLIDHVEVEMGVDGTSGNGAIGGLGDHHGERGKTPGDNVRVRYSHLHGNADGIKAANYSLYEHNFIRMRRAPGSDKHIDGIQSSGRSTWTARRNRVNQDYHPGHNAAIFVQAFTGTTDVQSRDILIEENWVNGGVYTIHIADGKNGSGYLRHIIVRDNTFARGYLYGAYRPRGDVRGNGGHWADTDKRVPVGKIRS